MKETLSGSLARLRLSDERSACHAPYPGGANGTLQIDDQIIVLAAEILAQRAHGAPRNRVKRSTRPAPRMRDMNDIHEGHGRVTARSSLGSGRTQRTRDLRRAVIGTQEGLPTRFDHP